MDDADEVSPRGTPPVGIALAVKEGALVAAFAEPVALFIAAGLEMTRLCKNIHVKERNNRMSRANKIKS